MIRAAFAFLGRHATACLAGGIFVGLVLPALAAGLRPLVTPSLFLLTAATMLRVDWQRLMLHVRRPGRLVLMLAWCLLASPAIMAVAVRTLGVPEGLARALVLWAAAPPLTSAPALAYVLGLDPALSLLMMVAGTLLHPLTLPPLALGLLGIDLAIGILPLMARLTLFVGGTVALAWAVRRVAGPSAIERHDIEVGGVCIALLIVFAIGVTDGIHATIRARPGDVALYAAAAYGASLAMHLLSGIAFAWTGRLSALTMAHSGGNNNLAIVFANLGAAATPDLTLFFIVVQVPIYTLPALLRPVYRALGADRAAPAADQERARRIQVRSR
jgi:ACR3 family arsenite efflux pump ArsB